MPTDNHVELIFLYRLIAGLTQMLIFALHARRLMLSTNLTFNCNFLRLGNLIMYCLTFYVPFCGSPILSFCGNRFLFLTLDSCLVGFVLVNTCVNGVPHCINSKYLQAIVRYSDENKRDHRIYRTLRFSATNAWNTQQIVAFRGQVKASTFRQSTLVPSRIIFALWFISGKICFVGVLECQRLDTI